MFRLRYVVYCPSLGSWQNLCAAVAALALALVWLMPASMARPCDAAPT